MKTNIISLVVLAFLCVCLFWFVGCIEPVPTGKYMQDPRTHLCFYVNATYGGSKVYSNVPCTEEVMDIIRKTEYYQVK